MFGIGTSELLIILVIVLIVFGAGKLPNVMADVGRGVKSFKKALEEKDEPLDKTERTAIDAPPQDVNPAR